MALTLRPSASTQHDLVALGEVMLRFDPGEDRISRARAFRVCEGGGEYNVARGLASCFGQRTAIVTALTDNPVGRLVEDLMRTGGVDLSHLLWRSFDGIGNASRNGIYFLERGFGIRPALGMMDRGHTAIAQLAPGEIDWDAIFAKARCFHTGGIFAALSESTAAVALEAMQAARRHGVLVSYDCNYRPSLWKSRGGRAAACALNGQLAPHVDVLFGHEGDLSPSANPVYDRPGFAAMAARLATDLHQLQVIATTARRTHTASRNDWSAFAWTRATHLAGEVVEGVGFPHLDVLDRVGGGDSFAAGVLYGLLKDRPLQWSVDCGLAHGALTMTTPGDSSTSTLAEVEEAMQRGAPGVQR